MPLISIFVFGIMIDLTQHTFYRFLYSINFFQYGEIKSKLGVVAAMFFYRVLKQVI